MYEQIFFVEIPHKMFCSCTEIQDLMKKLRAPRFKRLKAFVELPWGASFTNQE